MTSIPRPGLWRYVAAGLFALIVAGVCVRLGFWQLDRLDQRRSFNAAIEQARTLPPVSLTPESWAEISENPSEYLYRPARIVADLDPQGALILRGRSDLGRPGIHLAIPATIGPGRVIVVNLGWIASPDGATLDSLPALPSGPIEITGILSEMPPPAAETRMLEVEGASGLMQTAQRIDANYIQQQTGSAVPPLYLERVIGASSESAGLPTPIPAPELDDGPHLSYAIQWFSFGLIAIAGLLILLISARRSSVL